MSLKCPNGHGGLRLVEDTAARRVYWCAKCPQKNPLPGTSGFGMAYKGRPRKACGAFHERPDAADPPYPTTCAICGFEEDEHRPRAKRVSA